MKRTRFTQKDESVFYVVKLNIVVPVLSQYIGFVESLKNKYYEIKV